MNISNAQLGALISHWLGKLSPTLFVILTFIYWKASPSDGRVSQSIDAIAGATGLARRTVQPGLRELAALGAIEILSTRKERMSIQIPPRYSLPPVNVPLKPDVSPATVSDLILRLCEQRSTPAMLAIMTDAADNDEQRLQHCLDTFFREGKRWTTLELLTGAAQYELRPRGYFDGYWSRP
jgi:hypothetical protein